MATKKTGASGKAAPLDPKVASKLLDKLSTDNEFRRLFKKDPKTALIQAGYKVTKNDVESQAELEQLCCCIQVKNIAPKNAIMKAKASLQNYLTAGLGMMPIQLNAPSADSRRVRK
ncbi:MAG TPA: NHLP-related RiPP peptide [Pseudoxanthomonas sp.]|nr:NHLP-related RiPP peptide [Pseudoxanthomonas sp.]